MRPFLGTTAAVRGALWLRGVPGLADDHAGEHQCRDRAHQDHDVAGGEGQGHQRGGENEQGVRRAKRDHSGGRSLTGNPDDETSCHHGLPQPDAGRARIESVATAGVTRLRGELIGLGDQVDQFQHVGPLQLVRLHRCSKSDRIGPP